MRRAINTSAILFNLQLGQKPKRIFLDIIHITQIKVSGCVPTKKLQSFSLQHFLEQCKASVRSIIIKLRNVNLECFALKHSLL